MRDGSASKPRAPVVGSTAPYREQCAPWWLTVATGGMPQAVRRRRTPGRKPSRGASWAKSWTVRMAVRSARCGARRVGKAVCNGGTTAGFVLPARAGAVWAGRAGGSAPTPGHSQRPRTPAAPRPARPASGAHRQSRVGPGVVLAAPPRRSRCDAGGPGPGPLRAPGVGSTALGRGPPRSAALSWRWRAGPLAAREKAWRRCRFWRSRALFMRRGNASARSVIRGMAGRLSVCLCLLLGRERSRAEICIAANRKPYKAR